MQENASEVALLMQRITREYEAAQMGMSGMAQGTAQHAFINARMENMSRLQKDLARLVGPEEAIKLVAETWENE
jgi:hypothetical protein